MKHLTKLRNNLNAVIHSRNLYQGHSRFISARVDGDKVTVENLHTGERVPFVGTGWRDGSGYEVKVSSL